eukprot:Rmarinus@m.16201
MIPTVSQLVVALEDAESVGSSTPKLEYMIKEVRESAKRNPKGWLDDDLLSVLNRILGACEGEEWSRLFCEAAWTIGLLGLDEGNLRDETMRMEAQATVPHFLRGLQGKIGEEGKEASLYALSSLCRIPQCQQRLVRLGGLLQLTRISREGTPRQVELARVVISCVEDKMELIRADVLQLRTLVDQGGDTTSIHQSVSSIVDSVALEDSVRYAVMDAGILGPLYRVLDGQVSGITVQSMESAVRLVRYLCVNISDRIVERRVNEIVTAGLVPPLVRLLPSTANITQLGRQEALVALGYLSNKPGDAELFVTAGGLPLLLEFLHEPLLQGDQSKDAALYAARKYSSTILLNITWCSPSVVAKAIDQGMILPVVHLLQSGNYSAQKNAVVAIRNLCKTQAHAEIIATSGAIDALAALEIQADDESIRKASEECLVLLRGCASEVTAMIEEAKGAAAAASKVDPRDYIAKDVGAATPQQDVNYAVISMKLRTGTDTGAPVIEGTYEGMVNERKKPHGFGVLRCSDGRKYECQWVNGQMHGNGVFTDASGFSQNSVFDKGERRQFWFWEAGVQEEQAKKAASCARVAAQMAIDNQQLEDDIQQINAFEIAEKAEKEELKRILELSQRETSIANTDMTVDEQNTASIEAPRSFSNGSQPSSALEYQSQQQLHQYAVASHVSAAASYPGSLAAHSGQIPFLSPQLQSQQETGRTENVYESLGNSLLLVSSLSVMRRSVGLSAEATQSVLDILFRVIELANEPPPDIADRACHADQILRMPQNEIQVYRSQCVAQEVELSNIRTELFQHAGVLRAHGIDVPPLEAATKVTDFDGALRQLAIDISEYTECATASDPKSVLDARDATNAVVAKLSYVLEEKSGILRELNPVGLLSNVNATNSSDAQAQLLDFTSSQDLDAKSSHTASAVLAFCDLSALCQSLLRIEAQEQTVVRQLVQSAQEERSLLLKLPKVKASSKLSQSVQIVLMNTTSWYNDRVNTLRECIRRVDQVSMPSNSSNASLFM